MTPVRLEPAALRSRVKHSTTEPHALPLFIKKPNKELEGEELGSAYCELADD